MLDDAARLKLPEYCCNFLNESVRHQAAEPCIVNVVRVLRVFTLSKACVVALRPVVSTALTCLLAAINPLRRGALHYESGYVLEIVRRIVLLHPEHGDHDAASGIVFIASRLDLFGYLLNILENPESLGTVKEPQLVRAIAVEILNTLEKVRTRRLCGCLLVTTLVTMLLWNSDLATPTPANRIASKAARPTRF